MASNIPELQVSERLWQGCQSGALLRRHSHHQERPWQPLLRRQCQVPGYCHGELWRRVLHHYPCLSGNQRSRFTVQMLALWVWTVWNTVCFMIVSSLIHSIIHFLHSKALYKHIPLQRFSLIITQNSHSYFLYISQYDRPPTTVMVFYTWSNAISSNWNSKSSVITGMMLFLN